MESQAREMLLKACNRKHVPIKTKPVNLLANRCSTSDREPIPTSKDKRHVGFRQEMIRHQNVTAQFCILQAVQATNIEEGTTVCDQCFLETVFSL